MATLKRFLTLLLVSTLTAFTMHVWGADKTVTWTASAAANLGSTIAAVNGTATGTINTTNGSDSYSWDYTRTLISGADYMQMSSGYIQLGKNGGVENITFTTSAIPGTIKSVSVDCSSYNNAHNVSITVGSSTYLASTATAKWTTTSVKTGTGTSSGTITISFTDGTRALYIKSISVTYNNDGGGDPTLSSISVETPPTKVSYTEGEYFDPTGLVITRTYSNSTSDTYAYAGHTSEFSFTPSTSTALTTSDASVTITYGGKSTTQAITVTSGGGGGGCSYDLGTDSYASASTSLVSWTSSATATMTVGGSSTAANNYIPPTRTSTRFYSGATLTITPKTGKTITSVIFTATTDGYATVLKNSSWTNATSAVSGSTVTITPTTGTSAVSATIGGTCGFTCVEFVEGSTYTITATVDDAAHGSVSVTGNTITVTPNAGWVPDSYTVTSGTATAAQSGNIFTVTPSSDCTIRINFREALEYTVTINDNGGSYTETAYEGVPYELPDNGLSSCDDATLLGWATGTYTDHATGTSVAPTYDAPGTEKNITANTTFTAVYGTVAPSNNYAALKLESDLESGANYVLAAYYSSSDYAMNATMSNDRVDTEVKSLVLDEAGNAITDSYLIWRINVVNPATKAVTFYNAEINKYLVINGSNELTFADDPIVFNYTVDESGSAATWNFKSSSNAEYTLSFYTTYHQFNAYTSNSTNLYLYKQKIEVSNYTSKPQCCHAPGTPLEISSETTNFIGSGSTTISLTGGNGKPITWSCKDEADTDCSSYLSGKSNTGATLTLPTNAATKVYTVIATQADDETDPDNVICGATVTLDFTVKAQFTINFKTVDGGSESLYSSIIVTDGDSYSMPNIAEDFDCGTSGKMFVGWATSSSATAVESGPGASVTATSSATWYACWSTSAITLVPLYEKVTNVSSLTNGSYVLIVNSEGTKALGTQNTNNRGAGDVTSKTEDAKDYVYFTGTDVRELTVGKSGDYFTFYDAELSGYIYAASSSSNHLKTKPDLDDNGKWAVTVAADGTATATAQGTYTHNKLKYNDGSSLFSCYDKNQKDIVFYKKTDKTTSASGSSATVTTDMDGCTSGPTIRVNTNQWITAAAGQKVKTVIDVTAKNFEAAATLSATSSNANFAISLAATDVPAGTTGLATTLTVEYTPTESDITESTTITFTAGEVTKTITVNGRSLPDEFLLITKKTLWYALPGNMNDGPSEYAGVVVTPDDPTTPTMVGVSPSTVLYSLKAVTSDRYADHGSCVRLAGYNDLCLWSNMATGATKVNIQNKVNVATASGDSYEWLLTTTDGIQYTIANPNHPHYGAGRRLAYGTKFGLYTEPTIFYIVTAGCTSQPQEVNVSARRIDATFTWVSNTADMHIDLYTNEAMTEGHLAATASSAPYVFTGLAETTDYWYKLTPGTDVACAVTGHFKTSGPIIDIVEWEENAVNIFVDKGDINPLIIIDGQEEHGSISGGGGTATELFFAKYFEGAGTMKLLSIFNGTNDAISLANYSIFVRMRGGSDDWAPSSNVTLNLSSLGSIAAGQEIIFFTRPDGGDLETCSDAFLDDKVANFSAAESNPRWVECDGDPFKKIEFNGNDPIMLKKGSDIIDIFGSQGAAATTKNCLTNNSEKGWAGTVRNMDYGKTVDDPSFDAFYEASSKKPFDTKTEEEKKEVLEGFGINLDDEEIDITTARCILFRDKRVTSGDSAVYMNETTGTTFVTFTNHDGFKSEWYGRSVCMNDAAKAAAGVDNDAQATCNSYQDIANMDYNEYYIDYTAHIEPGTALDSYTHDDATKIYNIPIPDMYQYACLKLRFQLKQGETVLTETAQQVPIVVATNTDTNDPLFSELVEDKDTHEKLYPQSVERCQTCNVVVLSGATLTKGSNSDPKDVPEIANLKIYPGGKLIVPSGTEYTVKSLAFRRQEDEIASANIQGTLNVGTTDGTYLDLRIDPTNWHFISLPYDCKVSDIRFANEDETAIPALGSDYLLQWYNGERRAATKNDDAWEPVAADATLKKGLGYIFALPGDGKVKREFRFPMSNDVITEDDDDKIAAPVYGYGCDQPTLGSNHKGWNLVGAPYLMPYTSDITSPLRTGKIVEDYSPEHMNPTWDGSWTDNGDGIYYIAVPINNGWDYYYQTTMADYPLQPFTSYFVQVGGSDPTMAQGIGFNATSVPRSIVRRAPKEYEEVEDTHPVWCQIELTNPLGETDQTTILVSNDFTDKYDMQRDFVKMRGAYYNYYTRPVLASRNDEGEMAFNALPDASAETGIPLHYFAASSGSYTFTYNNRYDKDQEVKAVMLLDKQKNEWYDLMNEEYTFTSNRTENKDRFVLVVRVERKKTPQIATDIENIGSSDSPRKLLINGHVYIQRGNRIYDITGKQAMLQ